MEAAIQIAMGTGIGYNYTWIKIKEDEVKQGENHYQAALCQAGGIYCASNVVAIFVDAIPDPRIKIPAKICNLVIPLGSFLLCPLAALVKQGHYEEFMKVYKNSIGLFANRLPDSLGKTSTRCFGLI